MTDTDASAPEDDVVLAAEYVLHLLAPGGMAEAETRLRRDAAFAAHVRRWQEDFAPLALALVEVPPSPAAKRALMARLFDEPGDAASISRGLFARWRWGLVTALAAVAVVAALLLYPMSQPGPSHVAELQPEARAFVLTAALIPGDAPRLELTRLDGPVAPPGRATELWAIPPGAAPVSLGVLPPEATWIVTLPPGLIDLVPDLTLALSDEPEGGSPTGAPTGDVLAATVFTAL